MFRALTYSAAMNKIDVVLAMKILDVISDIPKQRVTKPKQQEPVTLTEHEFFFETGKHTMRYVCMGQSRIDAQLIALDAMRGSYFKLREEII